MSSIHGLIKMSLWICDVSSERASPLLRSKVARRRHNSVFIVFLFPVVMKFYCDVYCVFYTK